MSKLVKFLGDAASSVTPGKGGAVVTKGKPTGLSLEMAGDKGDLAAAAVGAGLGGVVWKKHRVLGALLGMDAGAAVRSLQAGDKMRAACDLGVGVGATAAALHYKKHPGVAWVLATLGLSFVASFVPGSRQHALQHFSTK